jgi:hypothetical protein
VAAVEQQPAAGAAEAVDIAVADTQAVDMPVVDRPAAEKRVAAAADRPVAGVADSRVAAVADNRVAAAVVDKEAADIEDIAGTADIAAAMHKADKAAAAQTSLSVGVVVDKPAAAVALVGAVLRPRP